MKRKKVLLVIVLLASAAAVYLFYYISPGPFPDHDTLLKGINEYTNVDAFTIQDIIKIDARHAFVPFISENGLHGFSCWVWDTYRWRPARVSSWGRPEVWKLKENDPSTYYVVWNLHPQEELTELKFYLLRDRGGHQSGGSEVYEPRVQLEASLSFAGNTYQVMPFETTWVNYLEQFLKVKSKMQSPNGYTLFPVQSGVCYGWMAVDAAGNSQQLEHTRQGDTLRSDNAIEIGYMTHLMNKDLEFIQK